MSAFFDEIHIQQILQAINIVDVIGNYIALKPRGKEMIGLCPFHDDKRPSLNVNENKQIFKCFACGAGGDVIKFIMLREQMTFPEAVRLMADRAGVILPDEKHDQHQQGMTRNDLEKLNRWAARFFRDQLENPQIGKKPREYIQNRQITDEFYRRFGLGWATQEWDNLLIAAQKAGQSLPGLSQLGLLVKKDQGGFYDRYRERLIFPVLDALGRVIGFGGRTLADDPAKYINSSKSALFNKSRALYGIHAAKDSIIKHRKAIIVEGYTDCIMAHQLGLTNVVAALGTALTSEHAKILSRYADSIVLVFDSDAAGQKAADRAIEIFFDQQIEVRLATLPSGKDPCDFLLEKGKDAFDQLVSSSTEALEFKWKVMTAKLERATSVNAHKRVIEEYLMLIAQWINKGNVDKVSQGYLLNRVAKVLKVSGNQVLQKVNRFRQRITANDNIAGVSEFIKVDSRIRSEQQILEVILNRPDLFEKVKKIVSGPDEFNDPQLRQIAIRLWENSDTEDTGSLVNILAGCESTQLCNKIMEMVDRGADRGNYEHTLEGALNNLNRLKAELDQQELTGILAEVNQKYGKEAGKAILMEKQAKYKPDPLRSRALNQ